MHHLRSAFLLRQHRLCTRKPVVDLAVERGVSSDFAPNLVWSLLTISLFLCNAGFAGYKLVKEHSLALFRARARRAISRLVYRWESCGCWALSSTVRAPGSLEIWDRPSVGRY